MADFGNPLVLGGNFDVLSTEIFFAIVGAQYDQAQAAILAFVLLFFTLGAFYAQRFWLGKKSYTTVSGKGDAGVHPHLPTTFAQLRLRGRRFLDAVHAADLRDDLLRQLRQAVGRRFLADLRPLCEGLRGRLERVRHPLARLCLEFFLDDDGNSVDFRAVDGSDRIADRLLAGAPELCR